MLGIWCCVPLSLHYVSLMANRLAGEPAGILGVVPLSMAILLLAMLCWLLSRPAVSGLVVPIDGRSFPQKCTLAKVNQPFEYCSLTMCIHTHRGYDIIIVMTRTRTYGIHTYMRTYIHARTTTGYYWYTCNHPIDVYNSTKEGSAYHQLPSRFAPQPRSCANGHQGCHGNSARAVCRPETVFILLPAAAPANRLPSTAGDWKVRKNGREWVEGIEGRWREGEREREREREIGESTYHAYKNFLESTYINVHVLVCSILMSTHSSCSAHAHAISRVHMRSANITSMALRYMYLEQIH